MKDLLKLVKYLLNTLAKGVGAIFLLCFLPLLFVMCVTAACLYLCAGTIGYFLACIADDGNLSKFVFPRFSGTYKWIPDLEFN